MTDDLEGLASSDLLALKKRLIMVVAQKRFNRIDFFEPYPRQAEFFAMGAVKRERLLIAGNQQGKSEAGADETSLHLTGRYPPDWKGRRWERPTRAWAAGESSVVVRDVQQKKLLGTPGVPEDVGTGMIPKDCIVDVSLARGVTDAIDTVHVRHTSGGVSALTFKSYEQGRTKFQGEPIDFAWCDEECPMDIYSEILTRTNATGGMVFTTFTPLKGRTELVCRFLDQHNADRGYVQMTIYDALHITPEMRKSILASYPAHERDARAMGVPMLGSGRVFMTDEEVLAEPAISEVPQHWAKLWGIDFGLAHPFGAVLVLWDKDADVVHIHHTVRMPEGLPLNHAAAMKPVGSMVPVAWPHDGDNREAGSGVALEKLYRIQGLKMLPGHATMPGGGYSLEAGVLEMDTRMQTGRLRVASHLTDWFGEYRMYHRKDGLIVKHRDDLMSATRQAIMMLRAAKPVPLGGFGFGRGRARQAIADGLDFDLT